MLQVLIHNLSLDSIVRIPSPTVIDTMGVRNQGNVRGRVVHGSGPRLFENDRGGGEGGAAGAATRANGGKGEGRYTVSLGVAPSLVTLSVSLSLALSLSVTLSSFSLFLP